MTVYNQNLTNNFEGDCTIFTLYQIIYLQYWIKVKYTMIDKTVDLAFKALVLLRWGAVFSTIYKWYAKKIYEKTWIQIEVIKAYIDSVKFEDMLRNDIYFGIWLKNWNKAYLNAIKKWKLTKTDIIDMKDMWWWFWHNHVYWQWKIYEVYTGQEVECSLETLRLWVKMWLWYSPARTLVPIWTKFNKLILKYLKELRKPKNDTYYTTMMTKLEWVEKKAFIRANMLKYLQK